MDGGSQLNDELNEWTAAGLIDARQAETIRQYEADRVTAEPNRLPLAAEAIGYIGAGLVMAAAALIIGSRWDDLTTAGRIISLAAPTLAAAVAGWWTGNQDEPAMQRLGSVLWLLSIAGVAAVSATTWVHAIHDGDRPDHGTMLFVGGIALCAAAAAWWLRRLELQQLAMFFAAITASLGVVDAFNSSRDASMSSLSAGIALTIFGAAWLAGGLSGRLTPTILANLSGAVLILVSAQIISVDNRATGLWFGLTAAVVLMVIGVTKPRIELLFTGTFGLFQWAPQIALFYLGDVLGAEATLFVIGALLIVLAGLMTRLYPWAATRHAEPDSESR